MISRHLSFILCCFLTLTANASPWEDFGEKFNTFLKGLDQLNSTASKEYTIDQLSKLHRDLYLIEGQQRYLLLMLENPGILDSNLSASIKTLRYRTNSARNKLKNIGKRLSKFNKQTNTLQKLLYRSSQSKKNWPSNIKKHDIPDYHLDHYLLTEGKSSFQALQDAREALEHFLKTH